IEPFLHHSGVKGAGGHSQLQLLKGKGVGNLLHLPADGLDQKFLAEADGFTGQFKARVADHTTTARQVELKAFPRWWLAGNVFYLKLLLHILSVEQESVLGEHAKQLNDMLSIFKRQVYQDAFFIAGYKL